MISQGLLIPRALICSVILLTAAGCSLLPDQLAEECKTRAYVRQNLEDYLGQRFRDDAPPRIAVASFGVPVNLTTRNSTTPGIDIQLASLFQAELLSKNLPAIIEVLPREDWPGKRDEFFSGNFGAISIAREAGYDMILVGLLEPLRTADRIAVVTRLIEVESGITVWYGRTEAFTWRQASHDVVSQAAIIQERYDYSFTQELIRAAATCAADQITADD